MFIAPPPSISFIGWVSRGEVSRVHKKTVCELSAELYSRYPEDIGYDLEPLNLVREKDGVKMAIVGVNFPSYAQRLEFLVKIEGDFENSPYRWSGEPIVTINGYRCYAREDASGKGKSAPGPTSTRR